ncbi:hypothetical protein F8271_09975 [Micromonospora sp. ALFpr18c]|uniref:hypothetical protein n=1 Tax=Micromonospora sp. ALFpr18c TaxID=1458665 RepID=UPI00124B0DFC|nr:hypothetical protein [Micromonospora sp. ALFpr18c]KAB1943413.1 hypothetical protein F8271_09975 [Micromonospora sp. ALFpr18c]
MAGVARSCDFCSDRYPVFRLDSGPVQALAFGEDHSSVHDFGTTWSACIACTLLAQTGKNEALTQRAVTRMRWADPTIAAEAVRAIHAGVVGTLRPGRTLLTDVHWPHSPITATALPKVRDRLTDLLTGPDRIDLLQVRQRQDIAASLQGGRLYAVDDEFTDLACTAAVDLPATVLDVEDLPAPHGLLLWAAAVAGGVCAASWASIDDGIQIVCYRAIGGTDRIEDATAVQALREQVGWLIPVDHQLITARRPMTSADGAFAVLAATWLLIAQRTGEAVSVPADRSIRKAYERRRRPTPQVRLVRIRSRQNTSRRETGSGESRQPQAQRQWISGYWRSQPHGPGRALRKDVYVFAYLRGPTDAPIAASTTVRILAGERRHPKPQ